MRRAIEKRLEEDWKSDSVRGGADKIKAKR